MKGGLVGPLRNGSGLLVDMEKNWRRGLMVFESEGTEASEIPVTSLIEDDDSWVGQAMLPDFEPELHGEFWEECKTLEFLFSSAIENRDLDIRHEGRGKLRLNAS